MIVRHIAPAQLGKFAYSPILDELESTEMCLSATTARFLKVSHHDEILTRFSLIIHENDKNRRKSSKVMKIGNTRNSNLKFFDGLTHYSLIIHDFREKQRPNKLSENWP